MVDHKVPNTSLLQTTVSTVAKPVPSTPSSNKGRNQEKNIVSSSVVVVEPNKTRSRSIATAPSELNSSNNTTLPSPVAHHSPATTSHSDKLPHIFKGNMTDSATERRSQASSTFDQTDRDFEKKINSLFSSLDITIKEINKVLL